MRVGKLRSLDDFFVSRFGVAITDIVFDRRGEKVRLLQNDGHRASQIVFLDLVHVDVVDADLPVGDVIEAVQEVGDRGLSRARWADEGYFLPGLGVESDVMEDELIGAIAKVDIIEIDLALHPHVIRAGSIGMRMLPRPLSREGIRWYGSPGFIFFGHDEGDISFIGFGGGIHQFEDALRPGEGHGQHVDLVGDLHDRHREGTAHPEERDDDADADGRPGVRVSIGPYHADDDVKEVGHVVDHGAEDHRETLGLRRVVAKFIVKLVEAFFRGFFVVEHLDDLLAGDHFLDIAISRPKGALLPDEEFRGLGGDVEDDEQNDEAEAQDHQSKDPTGEQHADQNDRHGDQRVDEHRHHAADHFAQGIDVVGIDGHDVPVRAGIEIG